jgi:DNA replication and repair protein RecF
MAETGARVWLRRLAVRDFRNLERVTLELPAEGLVVIGENGHGKTNLLEAVYYLELLRSMRGARDQDLIRFGCAGFYVAAEADAPARREVAIGFARAGKRKRATVDGGVPPRLSDALGLLPSVIFSPRDVGLVAGSPSERRRYLDIVLALTSPRYLAALQAYRGALRRRNAALRSAARGSWGDARVAVWEPALAEHGAVLWAERVAWVERAAPRFAEICGAIGERGTVAMRYVSPLAGGHDVRGALAEALERRRSHDLQRGLTHAGPHRDDLALTLEGRELRAFGSAGQQRTAAIALRMLEAETLRGRCATEPLFLLDDPFAELDVRRAGRIVELLTDVGLGQTVLTVPRASDIPGELTTLARWRITDGVLRPADG